MISTANKVYIVSSFQNMAKLYFKSLLYHEFNGLRKFNTLQHNSGIKRERGNDWMMHTHIYSTNMSMNYINIKIKKERSE